jgi:hypothetical protein
MSYYAELYARSIYVTGPPRSGTRLLTRIIAASSVDAIHDMHHGSLPPHPVLGVIKITRETKYVLASRVQAQAKQPWDWPSHEDSVKAIARLFPDSLTVRYEDIVSDPEAVIARIAKHFDIPVWSCPEKIYDANAAHDGKVKLPRTTAGLP